MANVIEYQRCKCGAVTLFFDNGANSSMSEKTRKRLKINLRGIKRYPDTYNCNHCVNHWGVDLCECGSGEEVGKCECGSHTAMQEFGEYFDSFARIIANFSK